MKHLFVIGIIALTWVLGAGSIAKAGGNDIPDTTSYGQGYWELYRFLSQRLPASELSALNTEMVETTRAMEDEFVNPTYGRESLYLLLDAQHTAAEIKKALQYFKTAASWNPFGMKSQPKLMPDAGENDDGSEKSTVVVKDNDTDSLRYRCWNLV